MVKFEYVCKCNNCRKSFYVPCDKDLYEKLEATEKLDGTVNSSEKYLHVCKCEKPVHNCIGVGAIIAVRKFDIILKKPKEPKNE